MMDLYLFKVFGLAAMLVVGGFCFAMAVKKDNYSLGIIGYLIFIVATVIISRNITFTKDSVVGNFQTLSAGRLIEDNTGKIVEAPPRDILIAAETIYEYGVNFEYTIRYFRYKKIIGINNPYDLRIAEEVIFLGDPFEVKLVKKRRNLKNVSAKTIQLRPDRFLRIVPNSFWDKQIFYQLVYPYQPNPKQKLKPLLVKHVVH